MRIPIVLGAAAAFLAHTATAIAAPAWCKGGPARDKPHYDMKSLFSETDPRDALTNLIGATCYADADIASYTKQIEAVRLAWSKKLGFTDADWVDINDWAHLPRELRNADDFFAKDRKASWSTSSPLDQFALLNKDMGGIDNAYIADAFGARLSNLGRLAYVRSCMARGTQDDAPVVFAMCATDVGMLDMAKIAAEISADKKYEVHERMAARIVAYETIAKLPQLKSDMKAIREKDQAYDKMFQLGQAAHTQFAAVDATSIALVNDLDDANASGSKKASQGCRPRADAAWKAAVARLPVKKLAEIRGEPGNTFLQQFIPLVISEPTGYLAALSLNVCATFENQEDALTKQIGAALERWPGFRGPRTGTLTAILTAGLELDQRGATITYPALSRDWIRGDHNIGVTGPFAIASVKVDGDKATITFAKQKVRQTRCVKGHTTNRVQRITDSGQFIYQYQCDKYVDETIDVQPAQPQRVLAKYTTGLAPGMSASVADEVVVAAYPKNSTTPSLVTGVAVK